MKGTALKLNISRIENNQLKMDIYNLEREIKDLKKWQQQARFFLVLFGFIISILSYFLI